VDALGGQQRAADNSLHHEAVLHHLLAIHADHQISVGALHCIAIGPAIERDFGRRYGLGLLAAIDHALAVRPADRPASVQAWRDELQAPDPSPGEDGEAADAIDPTRIERTVFVSPASGQTLAPNAQRDTEAYATTAPAAGPARYSDAYARTMPDPFKPRRDDPGAGGAPKAANDPSTTASDRAFQPSRLSADEESDTSAWGRVLRHPVWLGLAVLVLFAALVTTVKRHLPTARELTPPTASASASAPAGKPDARVQRERRDVRAQRERADDAPVQASAAAVSPRASERQARAAARREAESSDAARASSPAEVCGGRFFLSRVFCMKRECGKPEFAQHPQCVRLRQQEEANRPRAP